MKKFIVGFFAFIGIATVAASLIFLYFVVASPSYRPTIPESAVLTYHLPTELPENSDNSSLIRDVFKPPFSLYDLTQTLDQAASDKRIKGLVLRLDGSTLSLAKIQEIHKALKRFKKAGKFILAHVDTFGDGDNATGQYYLASIAHEIAMQPYGAIYLLGIGLEFFHGKKLVDDLKIKARFYKRDEYKSVMDPFTENQITPANQEAMKALGQSLYGQIMRDIALERELSENDVNALVEQAPLYGAKKAISLGLIDHVYYYDQCLSYALLKAGSESESLSLENYHASLPAEAEARSSSIAVVYGVGAITRFSEGAELVLNGEPSFSAEVFEENIEHLLKEKDIKAVILRLNTPGGSATASESMWRQVQRLREKDIPVVVSIGDYGASGGYWIATAANAIIAHPSSIVGSIGVIGGKFVLKDVWTALGIQVDALTFGSKALLPSLNHDLTPSEEERYESIIDSTYRVFLAKVAAGRQMDVAHVEALAKGRVWTGEDAYRLGLIDGLGDLSVALEKAKELASIPQDEEVNVMIFPKHKGFLERTYSLITNGNFEESLALTKLFSYIGPLLHGIETILRTPRIQTRMDVKINS